MYNHFTCLFLVSIGNLLEITNMQGRSFTRLLALRYFGFCNLLHTWSIWVTPTYRVYRLHDTLLLCIDYLPFHFLIKICTERAFPSCSSYVCWRAIFRVNTWSTLTIFTASIEHMHYDNMDDVLLLVWIHLRSKYRSADNCTYGTVVYTGSEQWLAIEPRVVASRVS